MVELGGFRLDGDFIAPVCAVVEQRELVRRAQEAAREEIEKWVSVTY